jgi:hypothetical protein
VNVDQPGPFRAVIPVLAEAAEQIRATYPKPAQRPDNSPFADMNFTRPGTIWCGASKSEEVRSACASRPSGIGRHQF